MFAIGLESVAFSIGQRRSQVLLLNSAALAYSSLEPAVQFFGNGKGAVIQYTSEKVDIHRLQCLLCLERRRLPSRVRFDHKNYAIRQLAEYRRVTARVDSGRVNENKRKGVPQMVETLLNLVWCYNGICR